jgi:TolB protein
MRVRSQESEVRSQKRLLQKSKNVIPEVLNRESRVSRENGNLIPLIVPPIKSGDSVWIPAFAGMTDFRHENILLQELQKSDIKKIFFFMVCVLFSVFCLLIPAHAQKIYIDITAPDIRKLPIAVQNFTGSKEISDIVRANLTFTGLFEPIDDAAQIERPDQPFNPNNWRGLGVALVVKGRVVSGKDLTVIVSAYDVSEGRQVLKKEYSASPELLRPLAHSIANDIYRILTGQQGIFRTKIAYVGEINGRKELLIMDWDGHRVRRSGVTGGVLLSPRWSPDGTRLLYSAERNRKWDIVVLDMKTMTEKNVVMLYGLNMAGNFFPDNRKFVFSSSKDRRPNIYVGDITEMKGWEIISSPWIDVSPAVSPDGQSILFVSNRSGNPQIYISDRNGHGIRRLTFEGSHNTSPVWSPNGDRIAFVRMIGGKGQIFTMKPDGSGLRQLTDRGSNEDPSFSPDGRFIAFTSDRDGAKGIYLMRVNGERQVRITPQGTTATKPGWSP